MTKRLLVHIGIGKAGSTAIQKFLYNHRNILSVHRCHYWGLHLEFALCHQRYAWQEGEAIPIFQSLDDARAVSQLNDVLSDALMALPEDSMAIWSQESLYQRPQVYLDVLEKLCLKHSVEIKVVAFVRDHLSYAVSAYKQWGICHKHYPGCVLPFRDWLSSQRHMLFYGIKLVRWHRVLGERLHLFNYDLCDDVVAVILRFLPDELQSELVPLMSMDRPNASPSDPHLLLHAMFNNLSNTPVPPEVFRRLLDRYPLLSLPADFLKLDSQWLPSSSDLEALSAEIADDRELTNALLCCSGQLPLPEKSPTSLAPAEGLSSSEMVVPLLFAMLLEQDERLMALEDRLSRIAFRTNNQ